MKKQALIHVENTEEIINFAKFLSDNGWEILSANKTEELLRNAEIPVTTEYTMQESAVHVADTSTLIRRIFKSKYESYLQSRNEENGDSIYLVCANIYPSMHSNKEKLGDLTKPINFFISTILRNSFLNYKNILILSDPKDYKEAMIQIRTENITDEFRYYLAGKALNLVSAFDAGVSSSILANLSPTENSLKYLTLPLKLYTELPSGMNEHQKAWLYKYPVDNGIVASLSKMNTQELSYDLVNEASFAWEQVSSVYENLRNQHPIKSFTCEEYEYTTQLTPLTGTVFSMAAKNKLILGASISTNIYDSIKKTYSYDTESICDATFGCSAVIDQDAAKELINCNFSVIVAPSFTDEAKEIFLQNKNIHLVASSKILCTDFDLDVINGGFLLQSKDNLIFDKWFIKTKNRPSQKLADEMALGTRILMSSKSNSAILIKDFAVVGITQSCKSAKKTIEYVLQDALENLSRNTDSNENENIADVLVADSSIKMSDSLKMLLSKGVSSIILSGTSLIDEELIRYCDENYIVLVYSDLTHNS